MINKKKIIFMLLLLNCFLAFLIIKRIYKNNKIYYAEDFGIIEQVSNCDKDGDGVEDYKDIMIGARAYIETKPTYMSRYYKGGYPNDGYGVCTDVIWISLKGAGYSLKDLVDSDISMNLSKYSTIDEPDPNIDFRRVKNLSIFLERNTLELTTDFSDPKDWQTGDIVVFKSHIAICSDKRNKNGIPYIIHAGVKNAREKNEIYNYEIIGHYRWKIDERNL